MRNRVPTDQERIEEMKVIKKNRENALEVLKRSEPNWTQDDRNTAKEHKKIIDQLNAEIKKFYAPQMVIAD